MDTAASSPLAHIQPIPCKNREVYSELNTLISEYLEVNGLELALTTFTKECLAKNLPCPDPHATREVKAAFTHYDGDLLLKSFDEGDLDTFLKLWKQFQNHIQVTSEDMKKLEVYLRVHFAIYPKAHSQPEAKQTQAMQLLKSFFEENSNSLSSDATILPLFALPFVADPRPHPIFKDLFHETWTTKLRAQLETTVNKYFELLQENITNHCKLASVVAKNSIPRVAIGTQMTPAPSPIPSPKSLVRKPSLSKSNAHATTSTATVVKDATSTTVCNAEEKEAGREDVIPQSILKMTEAAILYHQDRFLQLLTIHRKTRKSLKGVKENYAKLLKVSTILITALERSQGGSKNAGAHSTSSNLDLILHQCLVAYPEMFLNPSNQASPSSSKADLNHFKQLAAATSSTTSINSAIETTCMAQDASDVSLLFLGLPDISLDTLNYPKIKKNLISEKVKSTERLCLLQALRWLITKTPLNLRVVVVASFSENDLLGLDPSVSENIYSQRLFSCMLSPTPTYQKESLARLVNAFASTWSGRTYLTSTTFIIDCLIRSLTTFKTQEESFICHMVIATLQKLSLRKSMRRYMIEHQVIPWLVKYVKTELERDLIRSEVSQMLTKENGNNNNSDTSYADTVFNTYLMEYAWALLMNLALHPEAIKSSLTVDFEFLYCIVTMLTSQGSIDYFPYVLSTLFSLLRNPEFFEKAKTMELKKKLNPIIPHQTPDIQRHLRHLLNQLYEKPDVDHLSANGETDYDDTENPDPDEVEPELELPESWLVNQSMNEQMVTGDDLLIREYIHPKQMPLHLLPQLNQEDATNSQSQQTLANLLNSNESSFSKSSRENSSDTPPSNEQDASPGLILRPTTPTHSKSPRISRIDDYQEVNSATRTVSPESRNSSPSPSVLSKAKNPFLEQYNNVHTKTVSQLISLNATDNLSSSEHRDDELTETEELRIGVPLFGPGEDEEEERYEGPPTPNTVDSTATGRFSLHESPIITFVNSDR